MRRMVVGISGATGITYGVRLLEELRVLGVETHLVTSRAGEMTRAMRPPSAQELRDKADVKYHINDVGAAIASGSFRTLGMVIAPARLRTLAEVATGVTTSLHARRRRVSQRAASARAARARGPAHHGASAEHARGERGRSDYLSPRAGVLYQARDARRHGRPHHWARAGPVRSRIKPRLPLG